MTEYLTPAELRAMDITVDLVNARRNAPHTRRKPRTLTAGVEGAGLGFTRRGGG
jgi:hypothetical protein